jgi:hypothetical protein
VNSESTPMPMRERLKLFLQRLNAAKPAADHDSAMALIAATLVVVEDEFSGVPYNPDEPGADGRMYPPKVQFRYSAWERPGVRCYRHTAHATFVAANGAIEIRSRRGIDLGAVVFEKQGTDGKKVSDYDSPG